ncbi:EPIDERMAL PATTERNING FACTOR-like protein 6 [Cornus florida]|uniref:EPIDERMAL PATTERNING FACTOR-like protein 6 n=1 Tax=Cornus florida TaxID=4283 RepID=UPI0028995AE3|nr:EPIDERMAL PATTERNING FACTOR-like protein 6 [Cornus florida]
MRWVSAASRLFTPYDNSVHHQDKGQILLSPQPQVVFVSKQGGERMERVNRDEEAYKMLSALGSRPPNCEHKCGNCVPCNAIQVPTTTDHVGVHYANYEPEGWKCKCGTAFFNP